MSSSLLRGSGALRRLLEDHCFDVRQLDAASFRAWLKRQLDHWERDPLFAQRITIRDLRRSHPDLLQRERDVGRAAAAAAATASHARLQRVVKALSDGEAAIAGLTAALGQAALEKQAPLQRKLESFRSRQQRLRHEQEELIEGSPELQTLFRLRHEVDALRAAIGLDEAEARLAAIQKERGQRSGRAGASFEHQATQLIHSAIVPELVRADWTGSVHVLRGVTLGAARMEIDALVIREAASSGAPVHVLAMVETKRNPNDLAHGFRQRQENLAWLTGDDGAYDPQAYRTRVFTRGHFDRPAVHRHEDREFLFTRDSFRIFQRDAASSLIFDALYLVTRPGPLWGLSGAAMKRLSHRLATDPRLDLEDSESVERLRHWCLGHAHPIETPDLLRMYAAKESRARQILLAIEPPPWPDAYI